MPIIRRYKIVQSVQTVIELASLAKPSIVLVIDPVKTIIEIKGTATP